MAATQIHPTAVVDATAHLGEGTIVGPFAVIEAGVVLGAGCVVGPQCQLHSGVVAGEANRFHAGCIIGDAPQHLGYGGEPTRVLIGAGNIFREHCTIHRGMPNSGGVTTIGDGNFFMVNSHIGHDATVGNKAILANGAVVGGHASIGDHAFLSGNTCVHQHCRVGRLSMISGTTSISQDLPPFWVVQGINIVHGINVVGMRRASIANAEILAVRGAFKLINRSGLPIRQVLQQLEAEHGQYPCIVELIAFIRESKRGICNGMPPRSRDSDT